mmetsp:Transcript_31821/g.53692  ORF Transcript_31821/g.53692 Transcript_31821/m.53692 type:complete len:102 (+) Transcript_31821:79-384(+)
MLGTSSTGKPKEDPQPAAVVVQATPVPTATASSVPVAHGTIATPQHYNNSGETADYGICRRCRRQFRRRPDVHDGMAQYYRCEECEKHRFGDIIAGSCVLC